MRSISSRRHAAHHRGRGGAVAAAPFAARRRRRRSSRIERIDSFALSEPWRRYVSAAQSAQRRYSEIVAATASGPLRSNMESITRQVRTWRRGVLADRQARRSSSTTRTQSSRSSVAAGALRSVRPTMRPESSLQAQLDSAERIRGSPRRHRPAAAIAATRASASCSARRPKSASGSDRTSELGSAVDDVVTQLEALRLAVDEVNEPAAPGRRRAGIRHRREQPAAINVVVAVGTAVSRITGLRAGRRSWHRPRPGPVADAYNSANNSPNTIYELLLGGVLSATLVPLFTKLAEDDDDEATSAVISVGDRRHSRPSPRSPSLAAPLDLPDVLDRRPSEVDAGQYRAAGTAARRASSSSRSSSTAQRDRPALLNARRRFFAAAWAPVLSNLVIIVSLLLVPSTVDDAQPQLDDVHRPTTSCAGRWASARRSASR